MQTCRDATRSISDSIDHPLPKRDRLALWFHLLMCEGCRTFKRQAEQMRELARGSTDAPPALLPDAARERITAELSRARVGEDVDAG
jgi:predicted anti-sigma-YlaC factor YlaD